MNNSDRKPNILQSLGWVVILRPRRTEAIRDAGNRLAQRPWIPRILSAFWTNFRSMSEIFHRDRTL